MARRTAQRLAGAVAALGGPLATVRRLVALALALAALSVWNDKPGLEARYASHLDERPVLVRTDPAPGLDPALVANTFHYPRFYRVEWRGWAHFERGGEHAFRLTASGPARLSIDGREVLASDPDGRRQTVRWRLEPGLHAIEMSVVHPGGEPAFALEVREPRGEWAAVQASRLYDRRPGAARRWLRRALGTLGPVGRSLVVAGLLLAALFAALGAGAERRGRVAPPRWLVRVWRAERRGWLAGAGLGLLFAVATAAILPRTGSPFGWDDVRYLDIAAFDKNLTWVLNRYAHVYLLDLFIWLARGDAFLGARLFWSAQFGLVVCSLAVGAAALGPRLQVATFGVSLLLLFSQPLYFLRAGASVPDTTVGTLVMVAVALYLHRLRWGGSRLEWQIAAIGALTVWAFKSKELGIILLWLVALLAFDDGRFDLRPLPRKLGAWLVGAAAGLALLMALDAVYFGDPLYGLRPRHQQAVSQFNLADDPQQSRELEGWLDVVREGRSPVATNNPRMLHMALLVVVAALAAGWRRRSIELRLLHLLPPLYLVMLMLIHVRATYVFLARYLYPVVPVSCLLAAATFHYLGIDELTWKEARSPRFYVPAVALGFLLFAIVIPYQTFWIEAADFLPARWLESIDWTSLDTFVRLVAAPVLVLALVMALAVFQAHRPTRLLLAATLVALFLGQPFFRTVWELRTRRAWQRGETHLHGLRLLGDEIPSRSPVWVDVFPSLITQERMFGARETCERVVAVYLRRPDLRVTCWPAVLPEQDAVFMTARDYRGWVQAWPGLAATAVASPAGEVVLVRPSEAGEPPASYAE